MNRRIDFSKLGGLPVTQNTLAFMQDTYNNAFGALGAFFGDMVILTGVEAQGGQYTDGWISIQGEILPFEGGAIQPTFVIVENIATERYFDDVVKDVYYTRVARLGAGGISYNVSDLAKVGTIKSIFYSLCPINSVIPYEGNPAAIPPGWVMHNLVGGRVLVGISNDVDFDTLGKTGGTKTIQITDGNISHGHPLPPRADGYNGNGAQAALTIAGGLGSNFQLPVRTGNIGNANLSRDPVKIVQPYYVIGFIKKVA